jgi:hypothetical protein
MKYFLFLILFSAFNNRQKCIKKINLTTYYTRNYREAFGDRIVTSQKIIRENNLDIKLGITEIQLEDSVYNEKWGVLTNQVTVPANFWQYSYKSKVPVRISGYRVLNCYDESNYYLITKLEIINSSKH